MKIFRSSLLPALLGASLAAFAQQPASAPQQIQPAAPAVKTAQPAAKSTAGPATPGSPASASTKQPDRSDAYYHFQLGHMYEEMVAVTGRAEFASKAVDEYKAALQADPSSPYLASALAELYARTGNIREAVVEAQEVIDRDPDNLDARRLLGRIYLRSIGDLQGGTQSDTENILHLAIEQYEQIVRLDPTSIEDHLLLGRLYRLNNETGKAEAEFRTSVKLQPSSEDAVTTLALLYNEEGDTNRALEILQSVPESDRSPRIDSVLGYTYEQKKDYKRAIDAYRKAVTLDKDNLDAVRGLAQNLLNDNQTEAALEQYKSIAEADPQDAQTLLHISEIYRRDGQFEKALETLNKAQSIAPDSMEVEYNRAVIQESLGKYDEATKQLEELLARSAKPSGAYSASERNNRAIFLERLGTIYRDQNNTQQSVDTFRKMTELGDDSVARGYQQIIESYRDAKNWPAATAAAREAVAKLPNDRSLQMVLAGQEADNGESDAAIARVKAMLKGNSSDDREVWIALAQMNSRLRRYPEAEKSLAKASELSTKQEEKDYVNFIAGSVYERQKKYDEAESYFRKVLANDPKNAAALNYLGYMLADRGTRLDEALSLIRRAVALDPQNGAYLDSLGWVHYKMGKYDQAESALRKAIDRIDNDPTVHEHLGDVYQKTNRLKLAATQWERSLQEWKRTVSAEVEPADVAKVQKKLDGAKVKLARQDESASK
ncbi:MAG TPA: tetratricopeptide repeat protein [Candidatus Saccharimonadales bacterium]|nr:tetratricopeptide repeat protein [Candidatus Saccharimonadales bacterium]